MTKENFLALQREVEGLEIEIAKGYDSPRGDARFKELEKMMEESPWTIHPDYGCISKNEAILIGALEDLQKEVRAHHKMNVKKDFSLMVADTQASKAIARVLAERQKDEIMPKSSPWVMVGQPVMANGIQYTVTFNDEINEYAVNPINTANAGRLSQVRVNAETYESTGLPDTVKKIIRQHATSQITPRPRMR
jgi:hypothetical protein